MLNKKSIDDINVKGKRVLCRCDFNVPLDGSRITDETRLVAALPTIKKLIADGGKVILCSHLGKPKGVDKTFSLAHVAKRLSELLGQDVKFAADDTVVGDNARAAVAAMNNGDVILLEQVLDSFAHLIGNSPATGDDGIEIGCGILDLYPVICSVMGVFQHLCGFKQGFRGNTSPVQANTSQFGTFYNGHGHS